MAEIESYPVDFLLVHTGEWDPVSFLADALREAADQAYEEIDESQDFGDAVDVRYTHVRGAATLTGLTLTFEGGEGEARDAVESVVTLLRDEVEGGGPLLHALKFDDPLLRLSLARYAAELFPVEMQLREALSVVLLGTYEGDGEKLLQEVKPIASKDFDAGTARAALQNELFYLTFTDYKTLNVRGGKQEDHLLRCLREASSFEEAKRMIDRDPVHDEDYQDFVASLRQLLDAVERTRNCVAHNRTVPNKTAQNYPAARDSLKVELDRFLNQLAQTDEVPPVTSELQTAPPGESTELP